MPSSVRILCHDPGSTNYGLAVIEITLSTPLTKEQQKPKVNTKPLKGLKFKVLHTRKVGNTYKSLKTPSLIQKDTVAYLTEVSRLVNEYQVDFQIGERYMSRGMKGATIELVNMMLGTLRGIAMVKNTPLKVIPAAQWKVPLGRHGFDLEALYKQAKELKVTDHEVDAIFIGLYGAFTLMRRKPFFMANIQLLAKGVLRDLKKLRRQKENQ